MQPVLVHDVGVGLDVCNTPVTCQPADNHGTGQWDNPAGTTVGVIADTHGLLRDSALAVLQDCAVILHAGDIGNESVLTRLRALAPVTAVRGNVDLKWAGHLPDTAQVTVERRRFYLLHNLRDIALDPLLTGTDVVISGHSHVAKIERKAGVLYVNPGSAGPRRFKLPVTVARITLGRNSIDVELVELQT